MSQIFDALHKSETERQGIDPNKFTAAPELLEAAERQLAQGPTADKLQTTDTERERLCSFRVGASSGAVPKQLGM